MAVYVDHVAYKCNNMDEVLTFFHDVFGMNIKEVRGEAPSRKIWTDGGLQLNEVTTDLEKDHIYDHLGLHVDDIPATMAKAVACGAVPLKGKEDHWFTAPWGMVIELM